MISLAEQAGGAAGEGAPHQPQSTPGRQQPLTRTTSGDRLQRAVLSAADGFLWSDWQQLAAAQVHHPPWSSTSLGRTQTMSHVTVC